MFRIARFLYNTLCASASEHKGGDSITQPYQSAAALKKNFELTSSQSEVAGETSAIIDGHVTSKHDGYWLVNGCIYFCVEHILGGIPPEVGDPVHVIAKRPTCSSGWVATRVERQCSWEDSGNDASASSHASDVVQACVAFVEGSMLTLSCCGGAWDASAVCRQGYRPCGGDKVVVTFVAAAMAGSVGQRRLGPRRVFTVAPLLESTFEGVVVVDKSRIRRGEKAAPLFSVDSRIAFTLEECTRGYRPSAGDHVRGLAIENDLGLCTHRALTVEQVSDSCTQGDTMLLSTRRTEIEGSEPNVAAGDGCTDNVHQPMPGTAARAKSIGAIIGFENTPTRLCPQGVPAVAAPTNRDKVPLRVQKNGVELTGDFDFGIVKVGEESSHIIWIRNMSRHPLLYCGARCSEAIVEDAVDLLPSVHMGDPALVPEDLRRRGSSALVLATGVNDGRLRLRLLPAAVACVKARCCARSPGLLRTEVLFKFDNFDVVCILTASVIGDTILGGIGNNTQASSSCRVSSSRISEASSRQGREAEAVNRYRATHTKTGSHSRMAPPATMPSTKPFRRSLVRLPSTLPSYNIPADLIECMTGGGRKDLEDLVPALLENLSARSHQKVMSALLHLEEIQSQIEIRKFDMNGVQLTPRGNMLALNVPGLPDGLPSLSAGDMVTITLASDGNLSYEGFIHQTLREDILVKFHDQLHERYRGEDCNVIFRTSRMTFRRCHHAVKFINDVAPAFLFPHCPPVGQPVPLFNNRVVCEGRQLESYYCHKLNERQKTAVARIVCAQCRPFPYVVFGPPGTGKTMTVVEAILQVFTCVRGSRMLICAPSNSAADMLAERLVAQKEWKPLELVRFNSIRRLEEDVPEAIRPYCMTSEELYEAAHHRVVVSTCSSAGHFYGLQLSTRHFTHVFVDEAGQATEPECLIPLGLVAASADACITLAGDPMQLGAVIKSAAAKHYCLNVSFLERLMRDYPTYGRREDLPQLASFGYYDPLLVTKLVENYRSHPVLLCVSSQLFYCGELVPAATSAEDTGRQLALQLNVLPQRDCPLVFHGVRGEELRDGNNPSWFNPAEVVQVIKYLNAVTAVVNHADIGVITPYRKQREKIRSMVASVGLDAVKVGSVEEFQGQEKRAIIVSTVRCCDAYSTSDIASRLDFVYCPKRFNVAITRAESLLIVIGDPHTLAQDPAWRSFIDYCVQLGCYSGCSLPPTITTALVKQ